MGKDALSITKDKDHHDQHRGTMMNEDDEDENQESNMSEARKIHKAA